MFKLNKWKASLVLCDITFTILTSKSDAGWDTRENKPSRLASPRRSWKSRRPADRLTNARTQRTALQICRLYRKEGKLSGTLDVFSNIWKQFGGGDLCYPLLLCERAQCKHPLQSNITAACQEVSGLGSGVWTITLYLGFLTCVCYRKSFTPPLAVTVQCKVRSGRLELY